MIGNKAEIALHLLGLIERHGWTVEFVARTGDVYWWVGHRGECGHPNPTLIEALTAAANCERCTGGD